MTDLHKDIELYEKWIFTVTTYISFLFGNTLHWTQMADGHLGLGLMADGRLGWGLNGRVSQLRPVTSPGLKLPTQS